MNLIKIRPFNELEGGGVNEALFEVDCLREKFFL